MCCQSVSDVNRGASTGITVSSVGWVGLPPFIYLSVLITYPSLPIIRLHPFPSPRSRQVFLVSDSMSHRPARHPGYQSQQHNIQTYVDIVSVDRISICAEAALPAHLPFLVSNWKQSRAGFNINRREHSFLIHPTQVHLRLYSLCQSPFIFFVTFYILLFSSCPAIYFDVGLTGLKNKSSRVFCVFTFVCLWDKCCTLHIKSLSLWWALVCLF